MTVTVTVLYRERLSYIAHDCLIYLTSKYMAPADAEMSKSHEKEL